MSVNNGKRLIMAKVPTYAELSERDRLHGSNLKQGATPVGAHGPNIEPC